MLFQILYNYLDRATADSDLEKSSLFNSFFHSVFTNSSFYLSPVSLLPEPQSVLDDFLITESEVFQALSSLDLSTAMGCDGIGPRLLKHCALAVYQPLHHLFCLSLSQHYIPVEWRTHMVRPIFKSGDRNSVKNYRPISLLCVTSKFLERIVYNHIIDFAINSISPYQFGFLRHRSTLQQLLIFLEYHIHIS